MFFIAVKKLVYSVIDNFRPLVFYNIILVFSGALAAAFPVGFSLIPFDVNITGIPVLLFLGLIIGIVQFFIISGAVSVLSAELLISKKQGIKDFVSAVFTTWKNSLPAAVIFCAVMAVLLGIFQVTGIFLHVFRIFSASILFWLVFVFALSFQYIFAFQIYYKKNMFILLRKLFYFLIDNIFFSLSVFGISLILCLLLPFTFGILSGGGIVLLWLNIALSLRMKKYEYLEANPKAAGKKIPWDKILQEEQKILDMRALKEISLLKKSGNPKNRKSG